MKLTVIKQLNNTLKVAYNSDYELIKKLKVNTEYQCEIKRPRNYKFHKKYFSLIKMLFDNQERYNDINDLRHDLIIEAGYYRKYINIQGVEVKTALSISFAKMTQTDFDELYSKTLDIIVEFFNFDKQDIITNVEQYY